MGVARIAAVALAALTGFAALPARAGACRQALALGLDVSGSVDPDEYRLQLDGLAAALTHPDVAATVLAGASAPVRLLVYEWSGPADQRVIAGWSEITDAAALAAFAGRLGATRRTPADPSTALGTALITGAGLLAGQSECWKRTLDISGDGMSNAGPRPQDLADRPELAGLTVNALVIGTGEGGTTAGGSDLLAYFQRLVIRGPGAFIEPAESFAAYEEAMRKKLLRELEGLVIGDARP
jgi:hypothetical protein